MRGPGLKGPGGGGVGIGKREERDMVCPPHLSIGIGTVPKECYIDRNVQAGLPKSLPVGSEMTISRKSIPKYVQTRCALLLAYIFTNLELHLLI